MLWEDLPDSWSSEALSVRVNDRRRTHHGPTERARRNTPSAAASLADVARPIELVRERTERQAARRDIQPRTRSEVLNRAVNVLLAAIALLILAPIMVLVALAVKLTSRGPVLYSQTRVGLDRRRASVDALYERTARRPFQWGAGSAGARRRL